MYGTSFCVTMYTGYKLFKNKSVSWPTLAWICSACYCIQGYNDAGCFGWFHNACNISHCFAFLVCHLLFVSLVNRVVNNMRCTVKCILFLVWTSRCNNFVALFHESCDKVIDKWVVLYGLLLDIWIFNMHCTVDILVINCCCSPSNCFMLE